MKFKKIGLLLFRIGKRMVVATLETQEVKNEVAAAMDAEIDFPDEWGVSEEDEKLFFRKATDVAVRKLVEKIR